MMGEDEKEVIQVFSDYLHSRGFKFWNN